MPISRAIRTPGTAPVATIACLLLARTLNAATIDVCPDGSCDHTSIQAAVLASSDGDVIRVHPGNYVLPAGQEIDIFNRTLTIRGIGDVSGIVVQGPAGTGIFDIRANNDDSVTLENLSIVGGSTSVGGGLYAEDVELVVRNCRFESNLADAGGAAAVSRGDVEFDSCRFTFNDAALFGGAVYAVDATIRFVDCLFDDNASDEGGGIASSFCDMDLVRCRLVGNLAPSGGAMIVAGIDGTIPVLQDSLICGSGPAPVAGPIVDSGGSNTFTNVCVTCKSDIDAVATWLDPTLDCNGDVLVDACQLANGQLADVNLDGVPDVCQDQLVFEVPKRFPTIGDAVALAPDGSIVQVGPGTYRERVNVGGRDIRITGDVSDPANVVLDGEDTGGWIVRFGGDADDTPRIEGFTIRRGGDESTGTLGGAIYVDGSSARIVDCVLESNRAEYGGAIYATGGSPVIRNCRFVDNLATRRGGAIELYEIGLDAVIEDCVFTSNITPGRGGAIRIRTGAARLSDCTIEGCTAGERAGGIFIAGSGTSATLESVEIRDNAAGEEGGGVWIADGSPTSLTDCVIRSNFPDDVFGTYEDLGGNTVGGEDPPPCPADFDGDGEVGGSDLGQLLVEYGSTCTPENPCAADLDGDGVVNGSDLGLMLASWGPCTS